MKTSLALMIALLSLTVTHAGVVTMAVDENIGTNSVSVGTNEVAQIVTLYISANFSAGNLNLDVIAGGVTNSVTQQATGGNPLTVAGPAKLVLRTSPSTLRAFCTVRIEPESFPPDKTIILPIGTVGIIHLESSTNLIQWQDEWINTFSNTNQNRFFRIRADRSN